MLCPHCKTTKLSISERQGIEIDFCPDCRGIWLDRGELDKILEKSRADEPPREAREERRYEDRKYEDRKYGDKHHYKRRKSFLEELFD